jgi:2-dehydropantoate 2-reductase
VKNNEGAPMGTLIVGTGALACLFAAQLEKSGNDITILGSWPEGVEALRRHGVRFVDLDGSKHSFHVKVIETPDRAGNFAQCLVLVKSWQTQRVAKQIGNCLSKNGMALTLQNGLGNAEILMKVLTPDRVALGVTTVGARMLEPGCVQFTGNGKIYLEDRSGLREFGLMLCHAGFIVEFVVDPVALLWGKLIINAGINPLTALLRVTNGELLERPAARVLLAEVVKEAAVVAASQGITLSYPDPVIAVEEVARNTATNHSSMLQDILNGRTTEIEAINGAIVRVGEPMGASTPINWVLWKLVKSLEHD